MRLNEASILNTMIIVHLHLCFSAHPNYITVDTMQQRFPVLVDSGPNHNFILTDSSYGASSCRPPESLPPISSVQQHLDPDTHPGQSQCITNFLSGATLETYLQEHANPANFLSGETVEAYLQELANPTNLAHGKAVETCPQEPANYLRKLYQDHLECVKLHREECFKKFKDAINNATEKITADSGHLKAFNVENVADKSFSKYIDEIRELEDAILGKISDRIKKLKDRTPTKISNYFFIRFDFIFHLSIVFQDYFRQSSA